ncbi:MAG: carboxylating nicotinate-nucleotide diphosphorylase [Desulfohalobiaceae bacterium]
MSKQSLFDSFFQGQARQYLLQSLELALAEDGQDLTSRALFSPADRMQAVLLAKEETMLAGLPLIDLVLSRLNPEQSQFSIQYLLQEGSQAEPGDRVCLLQGPAREILKAERVILNFICHLSGIANLTQRFLQQLKGSRTRLLDTRKTLPGLRYPEKYAVRLAGGVNHRLNLEEMLMLKDNHIDRAGGITQAVTRLRQAYVQDCPPIEVECRNLAEVEEACASKVERIMLDNMDPELIIQALELVPEGLETEISGGVSLENLPSLARLGADYISVGCLTNSATNADLSLKTSLDFEERAR